MITRTDATIFSADEGTQTIDLMGVRIIFKATAAETNGSFSLLEFQAPAGFSGPPLHRHRHTDEAFYVLDGSMTFIRNGETTRAEAGAWIFVPRGVPHTFATTADGPARFLSLLSPAGFEGYFTDLNAALAAGNASYPEIAQALGAKYDQEIVPTA